MAVLILNDHGTPTSYRRTSVGCPEDALAWGMLQQACVEAEMPAGHAQISDVKATSPRGTTLCTLCTLSSVRRALGERVSHLYTESCVQSI